MLLICLKINKEALLAYLQLISYLQSTQSAQFGVNDRSAYQLTEGKLESITYKSLINHLYLKACDRRVLFIFIGTLVLKAHYERKKILSGNKLQHLRTFSIKRNAFETERDGVQTINRNFES